MTHRVFHPLASLTFIAAAAATALAQTPPAPNQGAAPPADAKPAWVRKADKGFFDDPVAVHPGLGLVALIRTDSASFANVELFDLEKKNKVAGYPLGSPQQIFEHIEFAGADKSLVIVVRDGKTGQRTAQRFDGEGKPVGLIGPATDIGFAARGDTRYLVKWDRTQDKKGTHFVVSTHALADFAAIGKPRALPADSDGNLTNPALRVLAWVDGYTRVFAQEAGAYDKAKDMRMPDRAVLFDVLRGEVAWRGDINDVVGWATAHQLRRRRPARLAFADIPEDLSRLELVDATGARAPLALAIPFEMYDLHSLIEHEAPAEDSLFLSLTVDPMNPPALERKKADVPKLDLYKVGLPQPASLRGQAQRAAEHLVRVPMDDRPVAWRVTTPWVVVLRKWKSFARGGEVLEVYRLR